MTSIYLLIFQKLQAQAVVTRCSFLSQRPVYEANEIDEITQYWHYPVTFLLILCSKF